MKKSNKILIISIALLLCSAIITVAVFSGTLAKYVSQDNFNNPLNFSKWKINISSMNDLKKSHTATDNTVVFKSSDTGNIITPGTKGVLSCIRVEANIGVESTIDFDGALTLGNGFFASERLVRDENGLATDYFPIIFNLYTLDAVKTTNADDITWDSENKNIVIKPSAQTSFKKTLIKSYGMETRTDTSYVKFNDITDFVASGRGFDSALDGDFDQTVDNIVMDRYYVVEWEWPYEAPTGSTYQTNQLDTSLCEGVLNNKDNRLFEMKLDLQVTISQVAK